MGHVAAWRIASSSSRSGQLAFETYPVDIPVHVQKTFADFAVYCASCRDCDSYRLEFTGCGSNTDAFSKLRGLQLRNSGECCLQVFTG